MFLEGPSQSAFFFVRASTAENASIEVGFRELPTLHLRPEGTRLSTLLQRCEAMGDSSGLETSKD